MYTDVISPDMHSSPPNLGSLILSGMHSTFNLVLICLIVVHRPLDVPNLSRFLSITVNGWQVNGQGMGLKVMANQDAV